MAFRATLLILAWSTFAASVEAQCSTMSPTHEVDGQCVDLFNELQSALLAERNNRYILPRIFYPESKVQPILVRVMYNVNGKNFIFGWSQRSVYSYFHAAVINQMRYQLPFWVMGFSYSLLTSEPSTDALMWTGVEPQTLSVLPLNLTIGECYDKENITQALYSVTEYLMIYADVSLSNDNLTQFTIVEMSHRAEALNGAMVSNNFCSSDLDEDAKYGMKLFLFGYCTTFAIILFSQVFFTVMLITPLKDVFVDEKECTWSHSKCIIVSFTYISLLVNFVTYCAEFHAIAHVEKHNFNIYLNIKQWFLTVLLFWCFLVPLPAFLSQLHSNPSISEHFFVYISLSTITLFLSTVVLSFVPYLVLMFAFPVNTSVLLTLHYTVLYSCTIVAAILLRFASERWYNGQLQPTLNKTLLPLHHTLVGQLCQGLQYACCNKKAFLSMLSRQLLNGQVDQNLITVLSKLYVRYIRMSITEANIGKAEDTKSLGLRKFTKERAKKVCEDAINKLAEDFFEQFHKQMIQTTDKHLMEHLLPSDIEQSKIHFYVQISVLLLDQKKTLTSRTERNQDSIQQLATTTGECLKKGWKKVSKEVKMFREEQDVGFVVDQLVNLLKLIPSHVQRSSKLLKNKVEEVLKEELVDTHGTEEKNVVDFLATQMTLQIVEYVEHNHPHKLLECLAEKFNAITDQEYQTSKLKVLTTSIREQLPFRLYQHLANKSVYAEILKDGSERFVEELSQNKSFKVFVKKFTTMFVQTVPKILALQYQQLFRCKLSKLKYPHQTSEIAYDLCTLGYSVFAVAFSLPLFTTTYLFMLLMYLILVGRYNFSSDVTKALSAFIPSVLVAVSTHYLQKYVFRPQKTIQRP